MNDRYDGLRFRGAKIDGQRLREGLGACATCGKPVLDCKSAVMRFWRRVANGRFRRAADAAARTSDLREAFVAGSSAAMRTYHDRAIPERLRRLIDRFPAATQGDALG